jgi:nucleotide-binding universal stress UspA family protein
VGGAKSCDGRVARTWNSRVGWDIVQQAPCPVLITRHTPATGRMVVGTDLSADSAAVVRAAALEQARTGAHATLVHCVPLSWRPSGVAIDGPERGELLQRLEATARTAGLRAQHRIAVGPVGVALVTVAGELSADLVVVGGGSRSRGGVAARVAREASCAVLIVV